MPHSCSTTKYENVFSFPINGRSKNGQVGIRYTRLAWMNVSCLRRTLNRAKNHKQQHCRPHFSVKAIHVLCHTSAPKPKQKVIQQATLQATLLTFHVPCHTSIPQKRLFNSQQQCRPLRLLLFRYHATHLLQKLEGSTVNNTAVLFMYHATHNYTPKKVIQQATTLQAALLPFMYRATHLLRTERFEQKTAMQAEQAKRRRSHMCS